ncbi:MAG TPA: hypothetical protein VGY58_10520, partial [Gemmataceae bacterium]|nr:hypothetical protein [Gemmataceae bacterium]
MSAEVRHYVHALSWNGLDNLRLYVYIPLPFLAPAVGAVCSRWSCRAILLGCGIANIILLVSFTSYDGVWYMVLPLFALVVIIFFTVAYALARQIAKESGLSLMFVVSLLQGIGVAALLAGVLLECAVRNHASVMDLIFSHAVQASVTQFWNRLEETRVHPIALALLPLYLVFLAAVDYVGFTPESRQPRSMRSEFTAFFHDTQMISKQRDLRAALFGWACVCSFMVISAVSLINRLDETLFSSFAALRTCSWCIAGIALGCVVGTLEGHPRRSLGLVPLTATGLCITYYVARDPWDAALPLTLFGTCCAILMVSLWT